MPAWPLADEERTPELLAAFAGLKSRLDIGDIATTFLGFSIAEFSILTDRGEEAESFPKETEGLMNVFAEIFAYFQFLAITAITQKFQLSEPLLALLGEELNERCTAGTSDIENLSTLMKRTIDRGAFQVVLSQYLSADATTQFSKSARHRQLAEIVGYRPDSADPFDRGIVASCARILGSLGIAFDRNEADTRAAIESVWQTHVKFTDHFRRFLAEKLSSRE